MFTLDFLVSDSADLGAAGGRLARAQAELLCEARGPGGRRARGAPAARARPPRRGTRAISPTSQSVLPTRTFRRSPRRRRAGARPSRPPSARPSGRVPDARGRRRVQLRGVEALARLEPSCARQLRGARAVEPVAARRVAVDVPGVDVPVREPPLDPVRLDRRASSTSCRLRLQVLDLDEPVRVDRLRQRRDEAFLGAGLRRRGLCAGRTAPNVSSSLRAHAVERRAASRPRSSARRTRARAGSRAPRAASAAAAGGTCRRRAPCRRAPRRRAARRRRRSSRRRS